MEKKLLLTETRGFVLHVCSELCITKVIQEKEGETHPVEGDAVFLQDRWRNQSHLVAKEGVAALTTARKKACKQTVQLS